MNTTIPQEMPATTSSAVCDGATGRALDQAPWTSPQRPAAGSDTHCPPHGAPMKRKAVPRKRLTIYLPVELLERARNAVYWTSGTTLAGLIEQALSRSLEGRESLNGGRFPRRLAELKGGRPRGKQRRAAEPDGMRA